MGFENGHLLRVTLKAVGAGGQEQVNTFHYDLIDATGGLENNNPQDLADRFRDDVRPLWQAQLPGDWTLDPVHVVDEFDPQNPTAARSAWDSGSPIAGTLSSGSDFLPPGCCPLATLRTDRIGRRFTGRIFLMGLYNEGSQNGGLWVSGFVSGVLQPMLDAIPVEPDIAGGGGLSDASANWCVYSRTQRAANADPYASHITAPTLRSQVHFLRPRSIGN